MVDRCNYWTYNNVSKICLLSKNRKSVIISDVYTSGNKAGDQFWGNMQCWRSDWQMCRINKSGPLISTTHTCNLGFNWYINFSHSIFSLLTLYLALYMTLYWLWSNNKINLLNYFVFSIIVFFTLSESYNQ